MAAVKICGLTRREDALAAEKAGARFGGVILAAGGPRTILPDRVSAIFEGSALQRCGVFVNEDRERVLRLALDLRLSVIQLHGEESPEFADELRGATEARVWKAVRPRNGEDFRRAAAQYGGAVDGLLLDGWSRSARGGTGERFPWAAVAPYRGELGNTRLIVAGGLNPANVRKAVQMLAPDAVDVSSGVERSPGVKNPEQIRSFVAEATERTASGLHE